MKIVAFDLAGSTGWAITRIDHDDTLRLSLTSGTLNLKLRDDEDPGARWRRARERFAALVVGADVVAWERIVANSGPFASGELFGLQAQLVEAVWMCSGLSSPPRQIEVATVAPSTLKKFAVGNGRAQKKEILAAARARWPEQDLETHDQADALYVLAWAQERVKEKAHAGSR